ncbi:hypothetical protein GlitD10_2370 [Gloeomargarita lithophora Alchichica-D10]|uniref:Uncharacterized protein n=1 Tax=Gloeomargarita lithophora Alchichica-D10 TaxID=1188229 RepID=A0A1J0AFL3_9CYAN|nr:hypothetical protein [Gloeomargarita lithophora]APB34704.1 hypothetical protein GlitD10_2370 [Gloeomargarita lithophora Alchichica-D10]
MAEIPKGTILEILDLMRRLTELINTSAYLELSAFNKYGEIGQIAYVLEQLQNVKEKAVSTYTRLSTVLLRISETQPSLTATMSDIAILFEFRTAVAGGYPPPLVLRNFRS